MLSIFVLLTGLRYALLMRHYSIFSRPAVMFFHLIFCPHHFSTQTDAPVYNIYTVLEVEKRRPQGDAKDHYIACL